MYALNLSIWEAECQEISVNRYSRIIQTTMCHFTRGQGRCMIFFHQRGFRDENQGTKVTLFPDLQNTSARTRIAGQGFNDVLKGQLRRIDIRWGMDEVEKVLPVPEQ